MLVTLFILLLIFAMGLFAVGAKSKKWVLLMGSTIIWAVIALQSFKIEVVTAGTTVVFQEIVLVAGAWLMTAVSAIYTLYGSIQGIRNPDENNPGG